MQVKETKLFQTPKFLIIQTAFIGDVVLGTAVAEKLHIFYPNSEIHFLLRKGNESLLINHPFIKQVLVWDKSKNKQQNLWKMISIVRQEKFTHVINLHRFATSGIITLFSGAPNKIGFDKNPFSFFYTHKTMHEIAEPYSLNPTHEIQRNQLLIKDLTDAYAAQPKLYPSKEDFEKTTQFKTGNYVCIAPSSVWYTKQFPIHKWVELIKALPKDLNVYLLGGYGDKEMAETIIQQAYRGENLCGQMNFLQSAALMKDAVMNFVNDSGPLHFASAVNAPVTAVFCSTVPAFGFGPTNENGKIVEISEMLSCRPCGLHGKKECPEGHFNCANNIKMEQLLWWISK